MKHLYIMLPRLRPPSSLSSEEGLTAFNMTLGIISQIVDNRYTLHTVSPSLEGMSPNDVRYSGHLLSAGGEKGTHHQHPQCGQAP
ncbi:hypothetical protein IE983_25530 [Enterobacter hormaechei]|uniref:Uncharacterized protein n=1 Tax=Enterobacter hormaechei TaxID=158836 RepID=A0A927DIE7_9ENTR|nr:hypothetical protein [Enterobacter hormaechei]